MDTPRDAFEVGLILRQEMIESTILYLVHNYNRTPRMKAFFQARYPSFQSIQTQHPDVIPRLIKVAQRLFLGGLSPEHDPTLLPYYREWEKLMLENEKTRSKKRWWRLGNWRR